MPNPKHTHFSDNLGVVPISSSTQAADMILQLGERQMTVQFASTAKLWDMSLIIAATAGAANGSVLILLDIMSMVRTPLFDCSCDWSFDHVSAPHFLITSFVLSSICVPRLTANVRQHPVWLFLTTT